MNRAIKATYVQVEIRIGSKQDKSIKRVVGSRMISYDIIALYSDLLSGNHYYFKEGRLMVWLNDHKVCTVSTHNYGPFKKYWIRK